MTPNEMGKNNANGCQLPATECSLHPTLTGEMERRRQIQGERERGAERKGDDAVRELLLMTFSECAGFCCSVDQKGVCCVCEGERGCNSGPGLPSLAFNAFCFIVLQKQKYKKKDSLSFFVWLKWIHDSFDFNGNTVHLATAKVFTQKRIEQSEQSGQSDELNLRASNSTGGKML